jgi:hypothetical protein
MSSHTSPRWSPPIHRRLHSIAWPDGFTVSFSPTAELRDDHGAVVARDGDQITLTQTNLDEAAGTQGDPYVAKGLWLDGRCYPFV